MRDVFPAITDEAWYALKSKQIDEFVRKHAVGTSWMQSWDHTTVAASKVFREFVEKVSKECAWLTALKSTERSQILCKMAQNGVQRVKDRENAKRNPRYKRKRPEIEDDGGRGRETARRARSETIVEASIKDENVVVSDFISVHDLAEESESITATSLHIRLTRRIGGIFGALSYQTQLESLSRSFNATTAAQKLFDRLDFEKLDMAAKLHLGFNVEDELLAIDYGTKQEPEWLFITDDASLRSTFKTWHMQHPKTVIVEVLLFDRPGFIPYRTAQALKESDESDDELDSDYEEDDEDNEDEETTGGSDEKQQEVGDDKKSDEKEREECLKYGNDMARRYRVNMPYEASASDR